MRRHALHAVFVLIAVVVGIVAIGCTRDDEFVGENGYYAFAITEETPPYIEAEDNALYIVETRVELPLDPPSEGELADLSGEPAPPFARSPWVKRGDYEIEVDWLVSNLSDQPLVVTVTANAFNEFFEYVPAIEAVEDEIIIGFSNWERTIELEPFERHRGTIREEEIDETAVDLATVVNGAPNANQIVHFMSQSALDPRSQAYIPALIPALTGFRLGLRSNAAVKITLEASVRVRDTEDRLVEEGDDPWVLPVPVLFTPVEEEEE